MKNIEKISEIIWRKSCWITAKDILKKIDWEINKTTVYRNLEKLLKSWDILEDFTKNGEKIYSKKLTHHHHFVCDKCWKKINIWCILESDIHNLENKLNFKVKNHSFILNWICENCS